MPAACFDRTGNGVGAATFTASNLSSCRGRGSAIAELDLDACSMPPSKFKPRPHKQKAKAAAAALQSSLSSHPSASQDANATEHLPTSKSEREQRKAKLRADLAAQQEATSRVSGKKRKRLDKYIETKLRKDENADLIKKLETQQVDTSLFRSAKKLGRRTEDRKEAARRALKEKRAGLNHDDKVLFQRIPQVPKEESDLSESDDDSDPVKATNGAGLTFGAGLKLDEEGNPIIKVRQRKKRKGLSSVIIAPPPAEEDEDVGEDDWEGFDSEPDSGNNSEISKEAEDMSDISTEDTDAWASQQRNDAIGFTPTNANLTQLHEAGKAETSNGYINHVNTKPGLAHVEVPKHKNVFNVEVVRSDEIQAARAKLPVVAEEQKIMEAIRNNDTTIIWGATGSGKTTQIPQFLYEAGYGDPKSPTPGLIGVTQPRRVAAVSMAKRVATELGDNESKVAHQIRFDSSVSAKTAIKFMTDGVLLREISKDFTLSKYSAVVIDEAHERSVNTDILIGMLSRVVDTRAELSRKNEIYKPLKLIIMSATLRIADFTKNASLFRQGAPPIVQAEGRQYPVMIHFARRTKREYVEEAYQRISKGHKKLPPGGILVFLTGQGEITHLNKKLNDAFPSTQVAQAKHLPVQVSAANAVIEDDDIELDYRAQTENDLDVEDDGEEDDEFNIEGEEATEATKMHILPLYSQLPTEQQMRVFEPAPDGSRMIVLATNVAETSLTIPGIRYVFDCGRAKEKHFNKETGVQSFDIGWISKASASQRSGRAGRTGPGHCYRLYSSAVFERDFAEFAEPEIQRTPIEGVVLQLKSMGIPRVANFPFPTPPDRQSLVKAERLLEYMGALADGKVTAIGQELSAYPLSPRLSRILVMAQQYGCIEHGVALVAALAVQELFVTESHLDLRDPEDSEEPNAEAAAREQRRKDFNKFHGNAARLDRSSDAIKLLTTLLDFLEDQRWGPTSGDFRRFARVKALQEAVQLRGQLSTIVASLKPGAMSKAKSSGLGEPTSKQVKALRQIVAAGYIDQVAIRADLSPSPPDLPRKARRATDVPYLTLFPSHDAQDEAAMRSGDAEERARALVFIHPSSVLAHVRVDKMPAYLVYSHLSRSAPSTLGSTKRPKTRMHPLTPLSAAQLVALAEGTPLLEEGKPVGKIEMLQRDGGDGSERRMCWTTPFLRGDVGSMGWPLPPARKVTQKRARGKGWVFDTLVEG
ncbi:hypothetical protein FH972_024874 [Carpinus fangiana]|uniref:RNA helicase n=1 Tax=Carpinus fangiana TaxID=176857 RepID=A0A5N6KZZ2_9ROSI|nr:hypothetical protein FH972_024874 [Carpinus fangiana]